MMTDEGNHAPGSAHGRSMTLAEDRALLDAWCGGDKAAGDRLIRYYFDTVTPAVLRWLHGDAAATMDIVQASFEIALKKKREIQGAFGPYVRGIAKLKVLEHFRGKDAVAHELISSRGHRAKLGLVAALSTRPELLLLDEPMLGLDVATKRMVFAEILGRVAEAGCTIVMSGHEIDEAESYADRLVLIRGGRVEQDEKITTLLDRYRILVPADATGFAGESPTKSLLSRICAKHSSVSHFCHGLEA